MSKVTYNVREPMRCQISAMISATVRGGNSSIVIMRAEVAGIDIILRATRRTTDAELDVRLAVNESFFDRADKRRTVAVTIRRVFAIHNVGMSVEMENGERTMHGGVSPQQRQRDGCASSVISFVPTLSQLSAAASMARCVARMSTGTTLTSPASTTFSVVNGATFDTLL